MRRLGLGFVVAALLAGGGCGRDLSRGACSDNFEYGCPVITAVLATDTQSDDPDNRLSVVYGAVSQKDDCGGCASGFSCEKHTFTSWLSVSSCVDAEGRAPGGRAVPTSGYELRVLVASNLGGVDQFGCSCYPSGTCAPGREFSPDPFNCSSCESGLCATTSPNLVPSVVVPVPGLATIRCGSFSYTTTIADGGADPAGGRYTSPEGFTFGPAFVFHPQITLPADTDCTLALSDKIHDGEGNSLEAPLRAIRFHTAR